jgi:hypothetical protein
MAVPEMLSRDAYGAINGALIGPSFLARSVAPLGAAGLWTVTQNYDLVLIAIIAGAGITAVSFWAAAFSATKPPAPGLTGVSPP